DVAAVVVAPHHRRRPVVLLQVVLVGLRRIGLLVVGRCPEREVEPQAAVDVQSPGPLALVDAVTVRPWVAGEPDPVGHARNGSGDGRTRDRPPGREALLAL